jgi:RNA polymerase sigma-70 factor (ECF subfamily)
MTTGDDDLARAAADGDSNAFALLLERHYDTLLRVTFRLTGRRDAAEDVTQDICLALPAKLTNFRGEAKFTTWLYRIAVNAVHDRRRRAATRARAADGWGDWELNRRAADADTAQGLDWLQHAMATLPDDLRDTAALTMGDEMSHAQAARVLGISEGTVSWRLSEIRKRLRALRDKELTP